MPVSPVYDDIKKWFHISKCPIFIGSKQHFVHNINVFAQAQRKDAALANSDDVQFYNILFYAKFAVKNCQPKLYLT